METVRDGMITGSIAHNISINHYCRGKLEMRKSFQFSTCCISGWGGSSQDKKVNILRLLLNNQSRELSCQKFHSSPAPPAQTNNIWVVWTCIAKNYFSYKSWMGFWFFPENDLFSAQEDPDCTMHGKSVPQTNELRAHRKRHLVWSGFIFKAERVT